MQDPNVWRNNVVIFGFWLLIQIVAPILVAALSLNAMDPLGLPYWSFSLTAVNAAAFVAFLLYVESNWNLGEESRAKATTAAFFVRLSVGGVALGLALLAIGILRLQVAWWGLPGWAFAVFGISYLRHLNMLREAETRQLSTGFLLLAVGALAVLFSVVVPILS